MGVPVQVNLGTNEHYDWAQMETINANMVGGETSATLLRIIHLEASENMRAKLNEFKSDLIDKLVSDQEMVSRHVNEMANLIDQKVDKEPSKGLSTNDYTDADKALVMSFLELKSEIEAFIDRLLGK